MVGQRLVTAHHAVKFSENLKRMVICSLSYARGLPGPLAFVIDQSSRIPSHSESRSKEIVTRIHKESRLVYVGSREEHNWKVRATKIIHRALSCGSSSPRECKGHTQNRRRDSESRESEKYDTIPSKPKLHLIQQCLQNFEDHRLYVIITWKAGPSSSQMDYHKAQATEYSILFYRPSSRPRSS